MVVIMSPSLNVRSKAMAQNKFGEGRQMIRSKLPMMSKIMAARPMKSKKKAKSRL